MPRDATDIARDLLSQNKRSRAISVASPGISLWKSQDTFVKCIYCNISCAQEKWSLYSRWNSISTFTELHVHGDVRWPMEVTSNHVFPPCRGKAGSTSDNDRFRFLLDCRRTLWTYQPMQLCCNENDVMFHHFKFIRERFIIVSSFRVCSAVLPWQVVGNPVQLPLGWHMRDSEPTSWYPWLQDTLHVWPGRLEHGTMAPCAGAIRVGHLVTTRKVRNRRFYSCLECNDTSLWKQGWGSIYTEYG